MNTQLFPFSAIVGQEQLKLALVLNAINPAIGGVLIRGEKGTAKSTAVRALAGLLPDIDVIAACPFGCRPDESDRPCDLCRLCRGREEFIRRRVRVVTLPLNATQDRVAGGIDFEKTLRTGRREIQLGVLARAHRGILYVDEVNLLDDHIVDLILDAAASGRNRIEREGIAFVHPSRFVLVGTMNPEEGELRPQLLDRFGLSVAVTAEQDQDQRVATMSRREAFDGDPTGFSNEYAEANAAVARHIVEGRLRLPQVHMPPSLRRLMVNICLENHVAGHRADLVLEQAARALAAYREHTEVTFDDLSEVAPLALAHRRRETAPPPPPPPEEHDHDHGEPPQNQPEDNPEDNPQQEPEESMPQDGQSSAPEQASPPQNEAQDGSDGQQEAQNHGQSAPEQLFDVGETFKVKKFSSPKDRVFRRGSG